MKTFMMIMKQKSMTKRFFMATILAAITTFAPSTSHAENNISLGISPFGFSKIEWYPAGEHNVYYKVDYNKSWNGNVTYEFMKNGFGFMTEFSYGQAKLDKLELIQWADIDHYEPGQSLLKEKDFDKDLKSEKYTASILQRIQVSMKFGDIVIMNNLESIYPSLYDLFNQSFTEVCGKKYARITIGSSTDALFSINDFNSLDLSIIS